VNRRIDEEGRAEYACNIRGVQSRRYRNIDGCLAAVVRIEFALAASGFRVFCIPVRTIWRMKQRSLETALDQTNPAGKLVCNIGDAVLASTKSTVTTRVVHQTTGGATTGWRLPGSKILPST